jgi:cell wall-associated NlpC family hydrolase
MSQTQLRRAAGIIAVFISSLVLVWSAPQTAAASGPATAVAAAQSRVGCPYVWGAEGPSSFDAGGLTQWSYGQAAVALPRTPQDQATVGTNIGTNLANIIPGDLVIYYADMHHVGIYVGGGQIVHASPSSGTVRYAAVSSMPIARIVRI